MSPIDAVTSIMKRPFPDKLRRADPDDVAGVLAAWILAELRNEGFEIVRRADA